MEIIEMGRLSSKGQITIPASIRKILNIKEGSKVIFAQKDNNIVIVNSNRIAFEDFQNTMSGAAKKAGLKNEQDVVDLVKEVRKDIYKEKYEQKDRDA